MAFDPASITSTAEAVALIQALTRRHDELQQQAASADATRKQRIAAAVAEVTALLGPDNATKPPDTRGPDNIAELLTYSTAEMHTHAGVGIERLAKGMQILARIVRDLAVVVGEE